MSETRGVEDVRSEIAAERERLNTDLYELKAEIRSLVPVVIAGLVVVGLVTFRKRTLAGVRLLSKLL
jgi:hypothetical protein